MSLPQRPFRLRLGLSSYYIWFNFFTVLSFCMFSINFLILILIWWLKKSYLYSKNHSGLQAWKNLATAKKNVLFPKKRAPCHTLGKLAKGLKCWDIMIFIIPSLSSLFPHTSHPMWHLKNFKAHLCASVGHFRKWHSLTARLQWERPPLEHPPPNKTRGGAEIKCLWMKLTMTPCLSKMVEIAVRFIYRRRVFLLSKCVGENY